MLFYYSNGLYSLRLDKVNNIKSTITLPQHWLQNFELNFLELTPETLCCDLMDYFVSDNCYDRDGHFEVKNGYNQQGNLEMEPCFHC